MPERHLEDRGATPVTQHVDAPAAAVWATLANGWFYASWVVGAARVRDVDLSWPEEGSQIHHSFGLWPLMVNDDTTVLTSVPDRLLILQAKGWPAGEARVELRIAAAGASCEVSIIEDAVKGPGLVVPRVARQPLIAARNREALRRLALLAEGQRRLSSP